MTVVPATFVDFDFLDDYEYDEDGRIRVQGDRAIRKARSQRGALPAGTCNWGEPFTGADEIGDRVLAFVCPCGCGDQDFVVASTRNPDEGKRAWKWDGNLEMPTLTPSIFRKGAACQWHGFLTKGVFHL